MIIFFLKSYPVQGWGFSCKEKEYIVIHLGIVVFKPVCSSCKIIDRETRAVLLDFGRLRALAKGCSLVRRD